MGEPATKRLKIYKRWDQCRSVENRVENPHLGLDGFTRILEKSHNEEERMKELEEMKIYGTFPVPQLDVITSLAQRLIKTAIVKINLVGETDQWIVSCSSKIDENVTPRDGFCAQAVWKKANFVVEDALNHPIMKDHYFVRIKKVGAYLGVPLITPKGNAIGAICAVHPTARVFSPSDIKTLEDLAKMAMNAIFLRHSNLTDKQIVEYQQIKTKDLREDKKTLVDGLRKFPDGVFVWSLRNKSIAFANEGFERITGWKSSEIEGKENSPLDYLIERESKDFEDFSSWFAENAVQTRKEFEAVRKDGRKYWAYIQISPTKDCHGRVCSFLGILSDVTERKQSKIELERNRDDMTLAVKAKSCFLANMSHEIKTPLNAICAAANSLTSLRNQAKNQMEFAQMIDASSESLSNLVSDILDYSKIEVDQMELTRSSFSIRDSLESCLATFRSLSNTKGVEMNIRVDKDVPDRICTDKKRLQQILSKLVANAITFTESGEISVQVSTKSIEDSDEIVANRQRYIQFVVRDTGIGIKEDAFKSMFQPFWQVDQSRTRRYGGTGLGLAISRGLAIAMGGNMWAESVFGKGSTFGFYVVDSEGSPLPLPSPNISRESPINFAVPFDMSFRNIKGGFNGIVKPVPNKVGAIAISPSILLKSIDTENDKKRGYSALSMSSSCILIQSLPRKISQNQ
eukprot:TRINITY_DN5836_c0_g1_i1.p1 TRINITY_DN5836_c0_g1~~TRINITY_DN5836_c0_g1_i1.p1  ORF type:complete len:686 (-),score=214.01 TRINITY_DN5836_c0_g1_i1:43-2100(-)